MMATVRFVEWCPWRGGRGNKSSVPASGSCSLFPQAFLLCHSSQLLPASLGSPSQVGELERWVCKLHPQERAPSSHVVSAWWV